MQEKYGFVYIWYDSGRSKQNGPDKNKRWYVGCHWGTEDDGYICSSTWMRDAYRRRPQDFKRRIISRVYSNRNDLIYKENQWLSLIKNEEIRVRYYNLQTKTTITPIAKKGRKTKSHSEEWKKRVSKQNKGRKFYNNGKEQKMIFINQVPEGWLPGRLNASGENNHFFNKHHSEEMKTHLSDVRKELYNNGMEHPRGMQGKTAWNKGIPCTQKTKRRISETKLNKGMKKDIEL